MKSLLIFLILNLAIVTPAAISAQATSCPDTDLVSALVNQFVDQDYSVENCVYIDSDDYTVKMRRYTCHQDFICVISRDKESTDWVIQGGRNQIIMGYRAEFHLSQSSSIPFCQNVGSISASIEAKERHQKDLNVSYQFQDSYPQSCKGVATTGSITSALIITECNPNGLPQHACDERFFTRVSQKEVYYQVHIATQLGLGAPNRCPTFDGLPEYIHHEMTYDDLDPISATQYGPSCFGKFWVN
jgi:hypothetical protein